MGRLSHKTYDSGADCLSVCAMGHTHADGKKRRTVGSDYVHSHCRFGSCFLYDDDTGNQRNIVFNKAKFSVRLVAMYDDDRHACYNGGIVVSEICKNRTD